MGTGVIICAGMRTGRNVVGVDRDTEDDMVGLAWERASHCWKFVLDHNIVALDERGTATEEPGQKLTEEKDWQALTLTKAPSPAGTFNTPALLPG